MLLKGKNIVIMGIRNKWSIAWGAIQSASEQGANIIATYSSMESKEKIEELIKEIPNIKTYECDVTEDIEIEKLFKTIKKDYGKIDGILHSIAHANIEDLRNDFVNTTRDGFAHANDISVYSLVATCRYAKDILKEGASVVSLTYYGAEKVMDGYNIMGVAKAALESSVRYLAQSLGNNNIRINAISAGPIKTLSAKGVKDFSLMLEKVEERAPLKRNVTQLEVGNVVTFLFSDLATAITGEVIHVDNGYNIMGV